MKPHRTMQPLAIESVSWMLGEICDQYEKSAPTVHAWADDLYQRIEKKPDTVVLSELLAVGRFLEEGTWMDPNLAANTVYKLLHRLGRDTTGQAGF